MVTPLSSWPWDNMGNFKYFLYSPLLAKALYPSLRRGGQRDAWCLHFLIITALRGLVHQLWSTYTSLSPLTDRRRIVKKGVDFKQIDQEWNWDNFLILHALVAVVASYTLPWLTELPPVNCKGFVVTLLLHAGISEPLYYSAHKRIHCGSLFTQYHALHHSSRLPQPFTAGHGTLLEHLFLMVLAIIPIAGALFLGMGSTSLVYTHILLFDFLRCMGHSNVEVIPHRLFVAFPFMKYLLYTATYHSLHHTEMSTNFCLFMPLYDKLGKTLNDRSWDLHQKIRSGGARRSPEFVFLAHAIDVMSIVHAPFIFRAYSSLPFRCHLFLLPLWPLTLVLVFVFSASIKTFSASFYTLRGRQHQTWVVPRISFQYFLPFAARGINNEIEEAILRADELRVKVISLGALNKNEALNGGGTMFVMKHPELKVRVVHGNTLTAAVILNEIPDDCEEVFLTGATSKLGRALALYLSRRKVRVMMFTHSAERFHQIQRESPSEFQPYLVHVTKYQAARKCKTWIAGKWMSHAAQRWAPPNTHFHQFVVPPIYPFRTDCTYGELAAMRLPDDVEGLGSCEYKLDRGVVHACHAGGVVHALEGWHHHEVGAIDVHNIDAVWAAALKHGLRPAGGVKTSLVSRPVAGSNPSHHLPGP